MKMELIQPFINSADAVMAEMLETTTRLAGVSMEEEAYRRKGAAAIITIEGDIHGRVIFDIDPQTAMRVAVRLAGEEMQESQEVVHETACELANMVVGNAVTSLNDQGFHFRINPPEVHQAEHGLTSTEDSEAVVMCVETPKGNLFLNISMKYNRRRREEREAAAV